MIWGGKVYGEVKYYVGVLASDMKSIKIVAIFTSKRDAARWLWDFMEDVPQPIGYVMKKLTKNKWAIVDRVVMPKGDTDKYIYPDPL